MSSVGSTVMIVGESQDGKLHPTVHELIAAAKRVASPDGSTVLCMPDDRSIDADVFSGLDVDSIQLMNHPDIVADQCSGIYDVITAATTRVVQEVDPAAVLFAKTDSGSVVAARVAARIGATLAADCIDLALNTSSGRIAVTRPVHGGSALGVYEFDGDGVQVVSMRPGSVDSAELSTGHDSIISQMDLSDLELPDVRASHVETVSETGEGVPLEQADVVVSGGRGLGGKSAFDQLRELCDLLGAALGASRAACDAGWIDHSHQVGLTGKNISPTVYITVGISGASQHMAGCSAARNIVAINNDPDANIFSHSRFGVVGDWQKILPAFTAAVAELDRSA